MSGYNYTRWITLWRGREYRVKLFLPAAGDAGYDVRQRVSEGGHDVPEAVFSRRFHAGWRNFEHVYRDVVGEWVIYDNSGTAPALLAEGGNR